METVVSIYAEEEIISALATELESAGFDCDEPQEAESMADAADAAIGPQEVQYGLQLLTIALTASTSLAILVEKIIDIRLKIEQHAPIKVIDVKTGNQHLAIEPQDGDDSIRAQSKPQQ